MEIDDRLLNGLLSKYQFDEDFLIKKRIFYDSWKCLKTQNNLSPYFCFYYLYDRPEYDNADNWTDYKEIYDYLKKRNYTEEEIQTEFKRAMNDRNIKL
jgi:ribonucleotide reductase alpha subunit